MKSVKVTLALCVIAALVIGVLRIFEIIPAGEASGVLGKAFGVIVLLGVGAGVVALLLTNTKPPNDSGEPGPKF